MRIDSLEAAAALRRSGWDCSCSGARPTLVLPSLWRGIAGLDADWAIRDENGKPTGFTPEFDRLWRWKDEVARTPARLRRERTLAARRLLIAPRLLAAAYALTGRSGAVDDFRDDELETLEREVAEVVLENEPLTGPEIRRLLGTTDRKAVDRAVARLQRRLVLTNAGAAEQSQGWRAIRQDLFTRRWRKSLRRLPTADEARRELRCRRPRWD